MTTSKTYLDLRHNFYDIREKLPLPDKELTKENRSIFKLYWYQAFDEWYLTQKLSRDIFNELWNDVYSDVILTGLKRNAFREVFCDLKKKEFSQGIRKEFTKNIERSYRNKNKEVLCLN